MSYRWIDDARTFDALLDELADEPLYGLDTEFHRERTYYPQLALVQLSWSTGAALVDPLVVPIAPLRRILEGEGVAIIHAASQDLEILQRETGTVPTRLFDPQVAAAFLGLGTPSLGHIARELLGLTLDKSAQLSDWMRRPLRQRELDYAASDVLHLLDLHGLLTERLSSRGRVEWAAEECERARQKDRSMRVPETTWWKLKGKGKLSGKARGVAQSLSAWRERKAASRDVLPRNILSDMAILGIAGRPPTSAEHLERVRGVDARHLARGAADEIMRAIDQGLELTSDELRLPPRGKPEKNIQAASALAMAWLHQVSADEAIESSMVATRDDVNAFLSGEAPSRLDGGWRLELAGRDLRSLLDGKAAIACEGGERLVLRPS